VRIAAALALLALAVWGYSTFGPSEYFDAQASALDVDKQQIQLSDGTQVWMRKGSSIQYAKSFEGKSTRRVQLTGEAYFEVAHDPQHPFRVELASGASVEVLGTQFDVRQSPDLTSVIVCSGKVKFSPNSRTQSPVLTANQMAVYDAKASTLRVSSTTTLNDLAWQTGNLEFIKTPLSQVLLDLEKFYHVKIELRNPALANCPHSALLSNQSLKNVLDGLAVTYQLKVTALSAGEYALSGGVCQ
jgi:ferric-dicitrate binding protein FerR (iron transport regulator)